MIVQLFFWLLGYLKIKVKNPNPERFINAALQFHFDLWHVRRTDEGIEALTGLKQFHRIRSVARMSRMRPKIITRHGLPFIWRRLVLRRWMLAGSFAFIACLYYVSSVVWFVEVEGNANISPVDIKRAAAELGLAEGVWRGTVDSHWIGRFLPVKVPELSWAAVELDGVRAIIQVAERKVVPEEHRPGSQPVHIVADKKGKIINITTHMGSPLVARDSIVEPGQILISSYMRSETNFELDQGGPPLYPGQWVRAEGQIMANVTYEQEAEVSFEEETWRPLGYEFDRYTLRVAQWQWHWGGQADEGTYWTDQKSWLPAPWRNSILPVELTITHFKQLIRTTAARDENAALHLADIRAWSALLDKIPTEARILAKQKVDEVVTSEGVRVTWQVLTEENIGRQQAVSPQEMVEQSKKLEDEASNGITALVPTKR